MNFKNLLFTTVEVPDEPTTNSKKTEQVENPTSQVSTNPQVTSAPISNPVSSSITADENIVKTIQDVIFSQNLPGPDYIELKQLMSSFNNMNFSDEDKLKAAYNVLMTLHPNKVTKDVIVNSIDTYINVVNGEKKKGLEEIEKLKDAQITELEKQNEDLRTKAEEFKKMYDDIQKQINENNVNIASNSQLISSKETSFLASVDVVMNSLVSDKKKIANTNF